eukprot:484140-Pelagomonas_calceolata.AAC.13
MIGLTQVLVAVGLGLFICNEANFAAQAPAGVCSFAVMGFRSRSKNAHHRHEINDRALERGHAHIHVQQWGCHVAVNLKGCMCRNGTDRYETGDCRGCGVKEFLQHQCRLLLLALAGLSGKTLVRAVATHFKIHCVGS